MNWSILVVSYPIETILIILFAVCILASIFVSTVMLKPKLPPIWRPEDEAAVQNYLREKSAPSLLVNNGEVVPLYALDDRFLRKINKIDINGELYNTKAVWKQRSGEYILECTSYKSPMLSFDAAQLRQLKKDSNIILYQFMEVDFSGEET